MKERYFNPRTVVLMAFIVLIAAIRVIFNFNYDISPLANFSPIGAMALFGGAYFNKKWKAFAFPLLMLFLSDYLLHQTVFRKYGNGFLYGGWYWVYGCFALMVLFGNVILKKITAPRFIGSVLACVFIHWIVTDFGVWMGSKTYSQDASGFLLCLENAIPFEWRFLTGTLVYGVVLFGGFELVKRRFPKLETV